MRKLTGIAGLALWAAPLLLLARESPAQEIAIAAAADLQFVLEDAAARFQKEAGSTVKLTHGSSGNFFVQLQNGAPFDMFFSANLDYAKKLESAGLTEPESYYEYATGKIVIWAPSGSQLDLTAGLQVLLSPAAGKIAIANPEHAPYGMAAMSAMKKAGVYARVRDKLVLGENISQTASFLVSGSVDVGIVALSLALAPTMKDKGRYFEIPAGDYPPIRQACVILKSSRHKAEAKAFLTFLKTPAMSELFRTYGFETPGRANLH
jgi:molybdate transport system substrate-binding protein